MQLTRYKKSITVESNNNERFKIICDGGTVYRSRQSYSNNKITQWWNQQGQTPFRETQKEYIVKELERRLLAINWQLGLDLYTLWNPGIQDYNQEHDAVFAHQPELDLMVLCTYEHIWLKRSNYGSVEFSVAESAGTLSSTEGRHAWMFYMDNYFTNLKQELAA